MSNGTAPTPAPETETDPLAEERLVRLIGAALPHRDLRTIRSIMRGAPSKGSVKAEVEAALRRVRGLVPMVERGGG